MTEQVADQNADQRAAELVASKEAARLEREAKSAAAKAAKEANAKEIAEKKAAREAAKAAKEAAKVVRQVANGVTRPADNTTTARIWGIADDLSAAAKAPASRADVLRIAEAEGLNTSTAATQYGRWRVFNGLKGLDSQGRPVTQEAEQSAETDAATVETDPTPVATL